MPLNYHDTSALAKAYVPERGSDFVRGIVASESVATSALAIAEMASMLGRRTREGAISVEAAEATFERFVRDLAEFTVLEIDEALLMDAAGLLRRGTGGVRLRTLDAIHIASARAAYVAAQQGAIEIGVFVSADRAS